MPALDCQRTVEVEIPSAEVEREYGRIARDLQKKARLPGFRPGKAPLSLVQQRFAGRIREEVLDTMLPAYLRSALEREKVEPVSRPAIEDLHFHPGEAIRFKARVEVVPPFELGDYRQVKIASVVPAETPVEEAVDTALDQLRHDKAVAEEVTDPEARAASGLIALVSSDQTVEGATTTHVDKLPIRVGAEETLPEFSQGLEGAAVGDTRPVVVRYPDNYGSAEVAGKTVRFELRVLALQREIIPPMDDALARQFLGAADLNDLRAKLRQSIEAERQRRKAAEEREQVGQQLVKMHDFPVPAALVEEQVERRMQREARRLAAQGVDPAQVDWNQARPAVRETAADAVKLGLILDRIATAEGVAASDEEIEQELERWAERLRQPLEAVRRRLAANGTLETLRADIRQDKTLDYVMGVAGREAPPPAS
ncbi:MAG: trigger factor [Terriglobales bacterium]